MSRFPCGHDLDGLAAPAGADAGRRPRRDLAPSHGRHVPADPLRRLLAQGGGCARRLAAGPVGAPRARAYAR